MRVREARESDIAEWVRMRCDLWPDCPEDHEPEVRGYFEGRAPDVAIAFVLERENGTLGGFIEINTRNYAEGCSSPPVPYSEKSFVQTSLPVLLFQARTMGFWSAGKPNVLWCSNNQFFGSYVPVLN